MWQSYQIESNRKDNIMLWYSSSYFPNPLVSSVILWMQWAGWVTCVGVCCPASLSSAGTVLLQGEPMTKPCCVRKVIRFGELGGLGNSNGGMVWRERPEGERRKVPELKKNCLVVYSCSVYLVNTYSSLALSLSDSLSHTHTHTQLTHPGRGAQDGGKGVTLQQFTESGGRV